MRFLILLFKRPGMPSRVDVRGAASEAAGERDHLPKHMASCCSPTLSVGCYSMCISLSPLPLACHRAVGRYRLCCDRCRLRAPKCGDCNLARTLQLVESFSKIVRRGSPERQNSFSMGLSQGATGSSSMIVRSAHAAPRKTQTPSP